MQMTDHGAKRSQQRGITREKMDLVAQWGTRYRISGGCVIYYCDKRAIKKASRMGIQIDSCRGVALVVEPNTETIVTVYRNHRPYLPHR